MKWLVAAILLGFVPAAQADSPSLYVEMAFGLGTLWGEQGARPPDVSVSADDQMRVYRLALGGQIEAGEYVLGAGPTAELFESQVVGSVFGLEARLDRPLGSAWRIGGSVGVAHGTGSTPATGGGLMGRMGFRLHNHQVLFGLDALIVRDEETVDGVVYFSRGFGLISSIGLTGTPGKYGVAVVLALFTASLVASRL